ncbi:unnamed protein product, partial [Candidula unifasciata]
MSFSSLSDDDNVDYANFCRTASSHLEQLDRYESQELLSYTSAHWLLSNDAFKLPSLPLTGLANGVTQPKDSLEPAVILFPVNSNCPPLCYREVHNIVRELTLGIYVFNQTPAISLEANFDQATVCNLPPAYLDTRVGQLLTNVDYMMKSLWHGAYIPRDKRLKFTERWREILNISASGKPETRKPLLGEFQTSGLIDITKDADYAHVYDKLPEDIPDDEEVAEERQFFMSFVDDMAMQLTFSQETVENYKNMYIVNANYYVSSIVRLLDSSIDNVGFERLKTRLQMHEDVIQEHLAAKQETCRQLELLKLISYLVPFLMGMRKRMKIPDVHKLLPHYGSDRCRTEREFPPLILGPDFKCKNFTFPVDHYFHLHGGISFDIETDSVIEAAEEFGRRHAEVVKMAVRELSHQMYIENIDKEHYNIPVCTIDNKLYYAIVIDFETYYGMTPFRPLWVRAYSDEMDRLRPGRLPITEIQMLEHFKKNFGLKKALKYKTPASGVKICAQRGMLSIFSFLTRKISGSKHGIGKEDEQGLSLLHHAAMHNRPQIISRLLLSSVNVNVCRNNYLAGGPTALHVAARCGSLDAVSCLLANHANIIALDQEGWAPIHYAAFFDHQIIVRLLVRKSPDLLDLQTKNEFHSTPLLLAATSGALSVVRCLIELKAEIRMKDSKLNSLVSLATLHFHTNVLGYLTKLNHPDIPVWDILVEMLSDEEEAKRDSAVKCLDVLSTSEPYNWKHILKAGAIPSLVKLLKSENEIMQSVTASVICNISENKPVKLALTQAEAVPYIVSLLRSSLDDLQSRASIIIADLATVEGNQTVIAECGAIPLLVHLLESEMEDVLLNAVNAIRVLCLGHTENQNAVAGAGGLQPLIEFLDVLSSDLKAGAASALAAAVQKNTENQTRALLFGAAKPLVDVLKSSRSVTTQVKAANALEALATNNIQCQNCFLDLDAPKALIRLLKNQHVEVREQGACSLWALAGNKRTQQRYIAERTTVSHIMQMLLEPSEKLLFVGCMMAIAFGTENMANQNKLAAADAFSQLVRLLRSSKTPHKILHMVVKVVGILCLGVAYKNNMVTQLKIAEEGGLTVLVHLLENAPSKEIQVEVAITLACVTLSCKENQEKLAEEPLFSFDTLLSLLRLKDMEIQLRAGMALTLFAFNNTPQQYHMREAGGIKFSLFQTFIESPDEFYQCYGAFQAIVLSRVIIDKDQVSLTAQGIEILIAKISSEDRVAALACSLLASLAHMRAGLSDAMVSAGVLDLLVRNVNSENELVRSSAAITLGYLTFNRTAFRLLFSICRNTPDLYHKIMNNIGGEPRINPIFIADFKRAMIVGLPCQFVKYADSSLAGKRRKRTGSGKQYDRRVRPMSEAGSTNASLRMQDRAVTLPNIKINKFEQ